jgi:hypothetical protein
MAGSRGWLAVKGKAGEAVLAELDLVRTGETASHAQRGLFIALPSGWFVVITRFGSPLLTEDSLLPLSRGCTVVGVQWDESEISVATAYQDGKPAWHVEHNGESGVRVLVTSGELPSSFDILHARFETEQDAADITGEDVDCFHALPVELAETVTGFEYELGAGAYGVTAFEAWKVGQEAIPRAASRRLRRRMARSARPWWKFW